MSVELRHQAKFCGVRPNRCRDVAIFEDGGRRHFGFFVVARFELGA